MSVPGRRSTTIWLRCVRNDGLRVRRNPDDDRLDDDHLSQRDAQPAELRSLQDCGDEILRLRLARPLPPPPRRPRRECGKESGACQRSRAHAVLRVVLAPRDPDHVPHRMVDRDRKAAAARVPEHPARESARGGVDRAGDRHRRMDLHDRGGVLRSQRSSACPD